MSAIVFVISFGLVTTQSQATNIQVDVNESKGEQIGDMSGNLYEKDGEATTFGWPWTAKDKTVKKNMLLLQQSQNQYITKSILMVNGIVEH